MREKNLQHWASDPEQVEAFILHRIDELEKAACATHLKQCEECRRIVQEEQDLIEGIRNVGRKEMKIRLKRQIQHEQVKRFDWIQIASLAAAIIIILGAVFTIRWFTDFSQRKSLSHEIVLKNDESTQHPIWLIGKVVEQKRIFRGTVSEHGSSFTIKQGNAKINVSIRSAPFAKLPATLRTSDESILHTLLERTPDGLQLTIYSIAAINSFKTGIETVTTDSLIVFFQGQQIAYHIPAGWTGNM